ncbi:MAG: leucine-rich repeat protein [Paludibacteraceae bacterium]|nr:leucine-rich repeat protein [Paludibacteraceae bacterium]
MEQTDFIITTLSDTTCAIKKYSGSEVSIEIPSMIEKDGKKYQVVEIADSAFKTQKIKSVSLPEGLTVVGESAFSGCNQMETVQLPSTLTVIKDNAFKGCFKLDGVVLPSSVTTIGEHAFEYCKSLSAIVLPESLKVVESKAFTNCESMKQLTIPEGVEEIKEYAFYYCDLSELVIPHSVKKIGKRAFTGCFKLTNVSLSEELKSSLDESAFSGCKSIVLNTGAEPASKEEPQKEAATSVAESSVQDSAQSGSSTSASSLYRVKVLSDTTCAIVNYKGDEEIVHIPAELPKGNKTYKVVEIGKLAFAKKKTPGKIVWSVERVNNINAIMIDIVPSEVDPNYNGYSTIREIVVPEGVKVISLAAFYSCVALEKIQLPQSLERIDEGAFAFCKNLKSVDLPDGVKVIPEHAFEYCENLESFTAKGVKEIKSDAFTNCRELKNVLLPQNVTLGAFVFTACTYMQKNSVSATGANMAMFQMKPIDGTTCAISGFEGEGDVIVPAEMQKDGKSYKVVKINDYAFAKKKKLKKVVLPDTIECIGDYAFSESSLTEIEVPTSVKLIKKYAFDDCSQLTKVTLLEGLENIEKSAFSGASSLKSITIPEGIKVIRGGTFYECKKLEEVNLPSSIEDIEEGAFFNCEKLSKINLAPTIYHIHSGAFSGTPQESTYRLYNILDDGTCSVRLYGAPGTIEVPAEIVIKGIAYKVVRIEGSSFHFSRVEKVILPDTIEAIGEQAFQSCEDLKEVILPKNLKVIGRSAFSYCTSLESIEIPESVEKVCYEAFAYCDNLVKVTLSDHTELEEGVFLDCPKLEAAKEEEKEQEEPESQKEVVVTAEASPEVDSSKEEKETDDNLGITEENCVEKAASLLNGQGGEESEWEQTAKMLALAQEKGDAEATYYLGQFYANGYGVEKDLEKAARLTEESADQDFAKAQNQMGCCYALGLGVDKDEEEAFEWFEKAAENDNVEGQYNLALCYLYARGTEQDYEAALEWLEKAEEQGHVGAQYTLGCCYFRGQGVKKDSKKAFKWFTKASSNGYSLANVELGKCYLNGEGVEKDQKVAFDWFMKSAEEDNEPEAKYQVAVCYSNGYGVDRDEEAAVNWCIKAAYEGSAGAQYELALDSERKKDDANAVEWYMAAANNGNAKARIKVYNYYTYGYNYIKDKKEQKIEEDPDLAYEWIKKAALENDDAEALYYLGVAYQNGQGVFSDAEEAAKWIKRSAEKGYVHAQLMLGYLYMQGEGIEENKNKAWELFHEITNVKEVQAQACFYLGLLYGDGSFAGHDNSKAVKWLEKSLSYGYKLANNYLEYYKQLANNTSSDDSFDEDEPNWDEIGDANEIYKKGWSIFNSNNHKKAFQYFAKAAEMGLSEAQYQMGYCYDSGSGVEQDFQKALEWYTKSADAGYFQAQYVLGLRYELGENYYGVEQDYAKSFYYYNQVKNLFPAVKMRLGIFYFNGYGVKQDYAEAVRLLEEAIGSIDPTDEVLTILADCYKKGLGVEMDLEKAREYLDKLEKMNTPEDDEEEDETTEENKEDEEEGEEDEERKLLIYSSTEDGEVNFEDELSSCDIDKEKVAQVEVAYSIRIPEILQRIITLCDDNNENYVSNDVINVVRLLTFNEVLYPKENLGIDYRAMGYVPVTDCLNSDSIVYSVKDEKWIWRSNTDNGEVYRESDDIMDILWDMEDEFMR